MVFLSRHPSICLSVYRARLCRFTLQRLAISPFVSNCKIELGCGRWQQTASFKPTDSNQKRRKQRERTRKSTLNQHDAVFHNTAEKENTVRESTVPSKGCCECKLKMASFMHVRSCLADFS